MRLLHVGDIHLKEGPGLEDSVRALEQVVQIARDHGVNLVLIPGDVFDGRSTPAERAVFAAFLEALDCETIICRGNHDIPNDLRVYDGFPGVQVFERPALVQAGDIDVLVIPWPERAHLAASGFTGEGGIQAAQAALGDLIRTMAADRDTSRPLVIMGHLSVVGAMSSSGQPLVGREIQVVAADLADTGAAYVALNHIHRPQDVALNVTYAGSLTVCNHGEEGEEKGVVLVDAGACTAVSFIPIPGRMWATIDAYVDDGVVCQVDDPKRKTAAERDLVDPYNGWNIRYRYRCTAEEAVLFDHDAIRARFRGAHRLDIIPDITRAARVRAAEVATAQTVAEKLLAWGAATGTEITPGHLARLAEIEGGVR